MVFAVYLPPQAENERVPLLWWLSGLTCNDENFMQKAGAHRIAAELGVAIVCPDTSPRGTDLPGEHDSYDLGSGAGFYVNATQAPWKPHYRMYDYVVEELPSVVRQHFPVNGRESISGHPWRAWCIDSGAASPGALPLGIGLCADREPMNCPWGKSLHQLPREDQTRWRQYDACELVANGASRQRLFIDQGEADQFLEEQLMPERLEAVCAEHDHPLTLRRQPGYDHSYFFIARSSRTICAIMQNTS